MKNLKPYLTRLIFVYLIQSFILMQINCNNWNQKDREIVIILFFILIIPTFFDTQINKLK